MSGIIEKTASRLPTVYDSNQSPMYKYLVLIILEKIFSNADDSELKRVLEPTFLSLFLSKLTESTDIMVIALTLLLLEVVCPKIPHVTTSLAREGVIGFVAKLTEPETTQKLDIVSLTNKKGSSLPTNPFFQSNLTSKQAFAQQMLQQLSQLDDEAKYEKILSYFQQLNQFSQFEGNMQFNQPMNYRSGHRPEATASLTNLPDEREKPPKFIRKSPESTTISSKKVPISDDKSMNEEFNVKESDSKLPSKPKIGSIPVFMRNESFDLKNSKKTQPPKLERGGSQPTSLTKISDADHEIKNSEKDTLSQIRLEICEYAKEIQKKIEVVAEKTKLNISFTQSVLKSFADVGELLAKGQANANEFGVDIFKKYSDLIKQHEKITNYELRQSNLVQGLILFLSDGIIGRSSMKLQKESGEEQKVSLVSKNSSTKANDENTLAITKIEITDVQYRTMVGRMVAFLEALKNRSHSNPKSK